VNQWVYDVLGAVHAAEPIAEIVSGGQTGVDLAGAVAGVKLGIPVSVLMPQGYLQRHAAGYDLRHTREEIEAQIDWGALNLRERKEASA